MDGDIEFRRVETLHIVFRDDNMTETEPDASAMRCTMRSTAHLTAEAHLTAHAPPAFYGGVDIARQDGGDDAEVHGHIGDTQAAGDIQEYVFLHELKADALPRTAKACSAAAGRNP